MPIHRKREDDMQNQQSKKTRNMMEQMEEDKTIVEAKTIFNPNIDISLEPTKEFQTQIKMCM